LPVSMPLLQLAGMSPCMHRLTSASAESTSLRATIVERSTPRSRGYGLRQRILPRGLPLLPGLVHTYSLADDPMVVLEAMDLAARPIGHPAVHEPHRRQEGQPHGRCRRGSRAFLTGDGPVMIAEIEAALLLGPRLTPYPHDRPPRHRRHPRRVPQPHRADARGSPPPPP